MTPGLRGQALREALRALAPEARDAAVEEWLGIREAPPGASFAGEELVRYHPAGVGAILEVAGLVGPDDVFVDVGAGAGKVALLVHLLTGARAIGLELQPELVEVARAAAARVGANAAVTFEQGDARRRLPEGTVYFLYDPFTGAALEAAMGRLREIAERHPIVVCALGLNLDRHAWLVPGLGEDLWLSTYRAGPSQRDRDAR